MVGDKSHVRRHVREFVNVVHAFPYSNAIARLLKDSGGME